MARRPATPPALPGRTEAPPTVLGPHVVIEGNLSVPGEVRLEGVVFGDVRCRVLIVAEQAEVDGMIVADQVAIAGRARGAIFADTLALRSGCAVEAEIYHRTMTLEQGAYFEGKSRRHEDPLSLAPPVRGPGRA